MAPTALQISENLKRFESELDTELRRLGRSRDSVTIVAVSKTFPSDVVAMAVNAGIRVFGENRVQESKSKIPAVKSVEPLRWHLIGHLQTNKAKDAVALFDLIHSVDRIELADALNHRAEAIGKRQDVLIQVNTSDETQKSGCTPEMTVELVGQIAALPHLHIQGLMTMAPFVDECAPIERSFRLLRAIGDRLKANDLGGGSMRYCSMGMTGDWRIALAEGSNMLRIGRAIFGERESPAPV